MDDVVPTETIKAYPNQKPLINKTGKAALIACDCACVSGDKELEKIARYDLRKTIKAAKQNHRHKMEEPEEQLEASDSRSMWQGLHMISDFREKKCKVQVSHELVPDELNSFYTRFEV